MKENTLMETISQKADPLRKKDRFILELERFHKESYRLGMNVGPEPFFATPEKGWSVAENFAHCARVVRSIALIFSPLSTPVLLLLGSARDQRPTLTAVKNNYIIGLRTKGFHSGPFTPRKERPDLSSSSDRKEAILREWRDSYLPLARKLESFSDEKLWHRQFFHPLMGRISLIDAAYMAIFHSIHHLENAEIKSGLQLKPDVPF